MFETMRGEIPMTIALSNIDPKKPRLRARAAPNPLAFAFTIEDAQAMGAPGRTKIYEMARQGQLRLIKVAGRTLVDGNSLRALLGA